MLLLSLVKKVLHDRGVVAKPPWLRIFTTRGCQALYLLLCCSREQVPQAAVVLVVAPDDLLVTNVGRAADPLLEIRLPVSDNAFPLLSGIGVGNVRW